MEGAPRGCARSAAFRRSDYGHRRNARRRMYDRPLSYRSFNAGPFQSGLDGIHPSGLLDHGVYAFHERFGKGQVLILKRLVMSYGTTTTGEECTLFVSVAETSENLIRFHFKVKQSQEYFYGTSIFGGY